MNTVIIEVSTPEKPVNASCQPLKAKNKVTTSAFPTPEALWKTFTPKRWEVVREMTGAGAIAIRELARRLNRDVRAVHSDVHALLNSGVLDKTQDGKIEFPYEALHVDFMLTKVA